MMDPMIDKTKKNNCGKILSHALHYGQVSVTLAKMNFNMKKSPGNSFKSVAIL